jgi:hypothetical protein
MNVTLFCDDRHETLIDVFQSLLGVVGAAAFLPPKDLQSA